MHFAIPVIGEVSQLALSSDGRLLAFVTPDETTGKNMLFVQTIGQQQATHCAALTRAQAIRSGLLTPHTSVSSPTGTS